MCINPILLLAIRLFPCLGDVYAFTKGVFPVIEDYMPSPNPYTVVPSFDMSLKSPPLFFVQCCFIPCEFWHVYIIPFLCVEVIFLSVQHDTIRFKPCFENFHKDFLRDSVTIPIALVGKPNAATVNSCIVPSPCMTPEFFPGSFGQFYPSPSIYKPLHNNPFCE